MYHTNPSSAMNRHEGNTLLYQAAGADSQHLTWLLVPPPSDEPNVNQILSYANIMS